MDRSAPGHLVRPIQVQFRPESITETSWLKPPPATASPVIPPHPLSIPKPSTKTQLLQPSYLPRSKTLLTPQTANYNIQTFLTDNTLVFRTVGFSFLWTLGPISFSGRVENTILTFLCLKQLLKTREKKKETVKIMMLYLSIILSWLVPNYIQKNKFVKNFWLNIIFIFLIQ